MKRVAFATLAVLGVAAGAVAQPGNDRTNSLVSRKPIRTGTAR